MEHLVNFIVWALAVIGISTIVTQSTIFRPIRERLGKLNKHLKTFLECSYCFSFWAAIATSMLTQSTTGNIILDGCVGCGLWFFLTLQVGRKNSGCGSANGKCGQNRNTPPNRPPQPTRISPRK